MDIFKILAATKDYTILEHMWSRLIDNKSFLLLENREEYKEFFLKPCIKVKEHEAYFTEKAVKTLNQFCGKLHTASQLTDVVLFDTVYGYTKKTIEKAVNTKLAGEEVSSFEYYIQDIISGILSEVYVYQYYRVLHGIKFEEGITEICLGSTKIILFTNEHKAELLDKIDTTTNEHFIKSVDNLITKQFVGNYVIINKFKGDSKLAKDKTFELIGQSIDFLRYIFCITYYNYAHSNRIKINLYCPEPERTGSYLALYNDNAAVIGWDSSTKPTEALLISDVLLKTLRDSYMLEEWSELMAKDNKTDMEKALLTSLHWVGEAQAEYSRHIAFVKYWTAIETLIIAPVNRKGFTKKMLTLISNVIFKGPYRLEDDYKNSKVIYDKLNSLYESRSRISHEGYFGVVSAGELGSICKICVLLIMQVMALSVIHKPCFTSLNSLWDCYGEQDNSQKNANVGTGAKVYDDVEN